MNFLTAIVLMGCAGYVLAAVFGLLHRMDRKTPRLVAWRVVLSGSLGVYGFLTGLVALLSACAPEWYQILALAVIAAVFAFSPSIQHEPHHDRRPSGVPDLR